MNNKDEKAEQKEHDKAAKAAKAAEPAVQAYPKMLYHENGGTQTAANADEEATWTKAGYKDTPQPPAPAPKG